MPQQPAPSDEIIPAVPASVIHELKYIDLLLLKTLAETESLTKTSARIGISVAKASRMLSSLRKLFNNELVQRCGPRMIALRCRTPRSSDGARPSGRSNYRR